MKIEEVIEGDQFGFRKGKGTRYAIGLMRIISERVLGIKKDVSVLHRWAEGFRLC